MESNAIQIRQSEFSVKDTMDRIVVFLSNHHATIYARINQQSEVAKYDIQIPPIEFLLFGDPKKGGALMSSNILTALDLPLKIIVWQDADNRVKIAFNDATYLQQRYNLDASLSMLVNIDPLIKEVLS